MFVKSATRVQRVQTKFQKRMKNNKNYRYKLDPSSRKTKCPNCGQKSFVGMIDSETGEFLQDYGRCDREVKCGFMKHPSKDGFDNNFTSYYESNSVQIKVPNFHSKQLIFDSMKLKNNLLKYFEELFGKFQTENIKKKYRLGPFSEGNFGTVFWQIDEENRIRAGKIINYFPNGKRTKNIDWVHSYMKRTKQISEFNLSQCLFGLHLISEDKTSTIAVVESEKTACIMSVVFPEFLWMACGAKGEFKLSKLEPIKHRKIIAYPDCEIQKDGSSTFDEWKKKSEILNVMRFDITVSNLLEIQTTSEQKQQGIDIADFFMI